MQFLLRLLTLIPLRVLHPLGAAFGSLVWHCSPGFRRRMAENLRQAGYDPEALAPAVRRELGMQGIEAGWIWCHPHDSLMKHVESDEKTDELVRWALGTGRPILFMTPHVGCYEVTPPWLAEKFLVNDPKGRRMAILYRMPKKAVLRNLVAEGRKTPGILLAPADLSGVRTLLKSMRNNEIVGVLPDQVPSRGEGAWVKFFGRDAYTMTLPVRLAKQFGAIRIVAWGRRIEGKGWKVEAELWDDELSGDLAADAQNMTSHLEGVIRRMPEQYLWSYNRYKCPAGVRRPGEQAE